MGADSRDTVHAHLIDCGQEFHARNQRDVIISFSVVQRMILKQRLLYCFGLVFNVHASTFAAPVSPEAGVSDWMQRVHVLDIAARCVK